MNNASSATSRKSKPQAARARPAAGIPQVMGMLPSDERPPATEVEPLGGRVLTLPSEPQFRRGIHQQSLKEMKDKKAEGVSHALSTPSSSNHLGPITRETLIMDIVYKYPDAVPVLTEAGLHCIGCQLSVYDTFEVGCQIHGFDSETIGRLLNDMNEAVKKAEAAEKKKEGEKQKKN